MSSPSKGLIDEEWNLGEYEQLKVVGKGGSSTVYKGVLKGPNRIVAIKQIDAEGISNEQILGIKGEIDTIKDLVHEHIVCYLGTLKLSSPSRILIFLEYADRGSLRQFYQRKGALSEPQAANCTRQILEGMIYLHKNGIAHRDVKCANCLLTKDGVVKLADFGASKRFESDSVISGLKGTPHWMAPEVIKGTQMTTGWIKADVWSMGCTVVEMVTGKLPFSAYDNPMTAMYQIANGEQPPLPDVVSAKVSEALKAFISACCALDPNERPEASQLKRLPFPVRSKNSTKKKSSSGKMTGEPQSNSSRTTTGQAEREAPGTALTPQTTEPTLHSTPSEALTEPYSNPLTRENSLAKNVIATAPAQAAEGAEGEFSLAHMIATDERLRATESAAAMRTNMSEGNDVLGNGVGVISTTGTGSNDSLTVQQGQPGQTDISTINTHGKMAISTLTANFTAVEDTSNYDSSSSGGENQEQELYLDDFEEGGALAPDDSTHLEASAARASPLSSTANTRTMGQDVQDGEFSFADMVAADRAAKQQSMSLQASGGEKQGRDGRVEYVPTPKASHGDAVRQRPENRPGRRGASKSKSPSDIEMESNSPAAGAPGERMKPPMSATLPAGHSAPLLDDCALTSNVHFNEIDAQVAHTQSILAGVGVVREREGGGDDPSLRSSQGSVDTWNNQILRPQPSAEVYIEQTGAPDRPQAPMTGEMRRVMVTIEQQQQQLRSSTSSNRSSMSGGGASTPVVDSNLLARAGSSGSSAIRREALEALDSEQDSDAPAQRPFELPFSHQPQQEEQSRISVVGTKKRSQKKAQTGARSQSANAANLNAANGVNMRLPPMGTLGPLGSTQIAPLGSDNADQMPMGIAMAEALGKHTTRLNAPSAMGGMLTSSSLASRPIHSAPSAVNGRNSIDGSLRVVPDGGLAALPPIQSLTPNAKSHKGTQKLV